MKQLRPLLSAFALALLPGLAFAQMAPTPTAPLDVAAVDAMVARTLKAFDVPGIAVAAVNLGLWPGLVFARRAGL